MSYNKKRTLKFIEGIGYGILTIVSGVATVVLAITAVGLAGTVVGIPLALLCGVGVAACAVGTGYFAYKTIHKFDRIIELEDEDYNKHVHHHPLKHGDVHFVVDKNQLKDNSTQLKTEDNITGTTKLFFAHKSSKNSSNKKVEESATIAIDENSSSLKAIV